MAEAKIQKRNTYTIYDDEGIGTVQIADEVVVVCVDLARNLKYGYEIPATCKNVQEKVKTAIENMTGLEVSDVNVAIAGVNMEQTK